jgi:thiol-disulfide isomerase/thioredoxin
MDYIDFLYVGKPFQVAFDPTNPNVLPTFIGSEENSRYLNQLFTINGIQQKMDSIQISFFKTKDAAIMQSLNLEYKEKLNELLAVLEKIEKNESSQLIKDILKANERVLPSSLIADPKEYLAFVKNHFFDHVDFNNQNLIHSSILLDKVMDFVFYLTLADDQETQNELYKNAIKDVLSRIENTTIKKGFIQALIQSFTQEENVVVIDELFEKYYNPLPAELQNANWKNGIQNQMKTAVGRMAPNFDFTFKNKPLKLYDLNGYKYYVVAFWSTTCSHCMKEIPMFYDYIKDRTDVKVLAIGLESLESKDAWETEVVDYPAFINILGFGKWDNPISRSFNIHSTPNYFILDENKKIIEKPYDFEALEKVFEGLK